MRYPSIASHGPGAGLLVELTQVLRDDAERPARRRRVGSSSAASSGPKTSPVGSTEPSITSDEPAAERLRPAFRAAPQPVPASSREHLDAVAEGPGSGWSVTSATTYCTSRAARVRPEGGHRAARCPRAIPRRPSGRDTSAVAGSLEDRGNLACGERPRADPARRVPGARDASPPARRRPSNPRSASCRGARRRRRSPCAAAGVGRRSARSRAYASGSGASCITTSSPVSGETLRPRTGAPS